MKVEVVMPKMGESITEGTIIKWHKKVGDKVQKDEIIFEITTDKVDSEIPSPCDGVLIDIKVDENQTVEVGTLVAVIESEDENVQNNNVSGQSEENIIDIVMPKMGESITSGAILKWHKKIGDSVKKDEIILEISTDKVDTEIPSPTDGIIKEILYKENDTIEVGTVIARIIPIPSENVKNKFMDEEIINNNSPIKSNRFYSPAVLNIVRREDLSIEELDNLIGTGIKGRVTKKDILEYIEKKKRSKIIELEKDVNAISSINKSTLQNAELIPVDHVRQKIIQNMIKSRDTSVHVTSVAEVDMTRIHNFINDKKNLYAKDGIKLTYLPFISNAVIKALKEYPIMNSTIEGDKIIIKKFINLGIAIAIEPDGLIVPNIKNADQMSIIGLAKAIAELSQKARTKKLSPDDVLNGTFTITNYGVFGTLIGTPIINQPEVAILGVGSIQKKPVVVENNGIESIAIRAMMYLSLSHDHRLIDGMLGGKFLMSIKNYLENFDEKII